MATARTETNTREGEKVITMKQVVKTIVVELTEREAEYIFWLTGKCNGNTPENSAVYSALECTGFKVQYDNFKTIQTIESKWNKPRK